MAATIADADDGGAVAVGVGIEIGVGVGLGMEVGGTEVAEAEQAANNGKTVRLLNALRSAP